jgi:hypothetical protein
MSAVGVQAWALAAKMKSAVQQRMGVVVVVASATLFRVPTSETSLLPSFHASHIASSNANITRPSVRVGGCICM